MPTGYTSIVGEGASFEQFVWGCARGMGALILMRDEPTDAPVPERFEPSPWYADRMAEAQAELYDLERMTPEEAATRAAAERAETATYNDESATKDDQLAVAYRSMIERTTAWQPPSKDHEGLKKFMLEQLRDSLRFDCGSTYQRELPPADGETWRAGRISEVNRRMASYRQHHEEEVKRTEERNEWIRLLRESVPPPAPAAETRS